MKKFTAIVLTLGMVFLMSTGAFAAFTDMPAGADGEVIQKAVDNGLISGFEDGTVQPATPITRAQMATIMSRAMNAEEKADISAFADVTEGQWYYDAMAQAVSMGAFKGDDKNCLNPNNTISRQEAFIVLSRIFGIPEAKASALDKFGDGASVADWAKKEVNSVAAAGYLEGVAQLRPLDAMTRLEFAQIMDKLVTTYIDEDGEYTTLPAGNVLIRAKNVSLKGVKSDNVVIIGDGVTETVNFTDCEIEDVVIRGKKGAVNSGMYGRVQAIGNGTELYIMKKPIDLLKKYEDGTIGYFYGKPGMGVLIPLTESIELQ